MLDYISLCCKLAGQEFEGFGTAAFRFPDVEGLRTVAIVLGNLDSSGFVICGSESGFAIRKKVFDGAF
jgi:hypothetical protein